MSDDKVSTWTVKLEYPIVIRGTTYELLEFRRAKAKDVAFFSNTNKKDGDKMLHMGARLSLNGFSDEDISELDAQDFNKIMKKLGEQMGVESNE
jgi:hypothetical protein